MQDLDALRQLGLEALQDGERVVGTAVIDEQEKRIGVLGQKGAKFVRLQSIRLVVAGDNQDTAGRTHGEINEYAVTRRATGGTGSEERRNGDEGVASIGIVTRRANPFHYIRFNPGAEAGERCCRIRPGDFPRDCGGSNRRLPAANACGNPEWIPVRARYSYGRGGWCGNRRPRLRRCRASGLRLGNYEAGRYCSGMLLPVRDPALVSGKRRRRGR